MTNSRDETRGEAPRTEPSDALETCDLMCGAKGDEIESDATLKCRKETASRHLRCAKEVARNEGHSALHSSKLAPTAGRILERNTEQLESEDRACYATELLGATGVGRPPSSEGIFILWHSI